MLQNPLPWKYPDWTHVPIFSSLAESYDKTFALIHVEYLENSVGMKFSMAHPPSNKNPK